MTEGTMRRLLITTILLLAPASIRAQSSASYRLDEHALNAGGRPAAGVVATSPSYRLGLDSIGESIAGRPMSGASYRMDGGFTAAYPPPGEVGGLAILADAQTLTWSWEPSATSYNVYTGQRSTLPGGYGTCAAAQVAGSSWSDPSTPDSRSALFYLVTGRSRLWEEGTKGNSSTGAERGNPSPCP